MKIVGADPISARCKYCIFAKISVGDGFPVPRCKAFYNKRTPLFLSDKKIKIGVFCYEINTPENCYRDLGQKPVPCNICVRFYAKIRQFGRADIESAPTKIGFMLWCKLT